MLGKKHTCIVPKTYLTQCNDLRESYIDGDAACVANSRRVVRDEPWSEVFLPVNTKLRCRLDDCRYHVTVLKKHCAEIKDARKSE
jgi:hypothetical protein